MRRVYLLVYSNVIGDRDVMKGILNSIEGVLDWRCDMPNSFYVISEMNASTLVDRIHARIQAESCRFFITENQQTMKDICQKILGIFSTLY